jgi:predicted transposase YbfD/YdcC
MSVEKLVEHFSALEDPRCAGKVEHRLIDILVIAVCAVIACAESWDDIALYGRNKLNWLQSFLTLANGIPSHDTFRRVFMLIDPDAFEACFSTWAQSFAEAFDREVVAIDGKTLRRSFDRGRVQGPLHLVSAWASEQGLALGQRVVDGKSNEITAIPALLETLDLKNSIVTLDAMGCQKTIANQILDRGADYLLVLNTARRSWRRRSVASGIVSPATPRPSRCSTPSTTVMAAWSAGAYSSAHKPPAWKRCAPGPGCAPYWRWKPSAVSLDPARSRPRSATSCQAVVMTPRCWFRRSAGIGP